MARLAVALSGFYLVSLLATHKTVKFSEPCSRTTKELTLLRRNFTLVRCRVVAARQHLSDSYPAGIFPFYRAPSFSTIVLRSLARCLLLLASPLYSSCSRCSRIGEAFSSEHAARSGCDQEHPSRSSAPRPVWRRLGAAARKRTPAMPSNLFVVVFPRRVQARTVSRASL